MCYDLKLPEKAAQPDNKNMSHVLHQGALMLLIFLAHENEKLHCTKYYQKYVISNMRRNYNGAQGENDHFKQIYSTRSKVENHQSKLSPEYARKKISQIKSK